MTAAPRLPPAGALPGTVKAYAAVVVASYVVRSFDEQPGFPWVQLVVSLVLVAGVWRGWAVAWAVALLIDLVPVALAVYLTTWTGLSLPGLLLLALGAASVVLLLVPATRRHVFGDPRADSGEPAPRRRRGAP